MKPTVSRLEVRTIASIWALIVSLAFLPVLVNHVDAGPLRAMAGADLSAYATKASPTFTGTTTFQGHSLYSADNTYDIGAAGATRPRSIYAGTSITAGGGLNAGTAGISISGVGGNGSYTNGGGYQIWIASGVLTTQNASASGPATLVNGTATGAALSTVNVVKSVTAFTNAAAKTVLTITVPNAAHSASVRVRVTGSLGAGGAIGANEASATNEYIVTVTRTAGVNAVAAISAAHGASASAVAGAATVTAVATLAAVVGAVGASNTINVQVTITRSAGTSDNHTAVLTGEVLNANATGVTIS